jgi:hypothetical protein
LVVAASAPRDKKKFGGRTSRKVDDVAPSKGRMKRRLGVPIVIAAIAAAGVRHLFYTPPIGCMPPSRDFARTKSDIVSIESALEQFAADHDGRFPIELEPLWTPDEQGRKYLNVGRAPLDAWKRPYLYEPRSRTDEAPRVGTLGRDGAPGGEGDDADIDNGMLREMSGDAR